jgi:hypothetical protein
LSLGKTKLKTLGTLAEGSQAQGELSLDSPEGLARYAQILKPSILAVLNANRSKERLVIACLVVLLVLACVLAAYGNTHDLRVAVVPGLGFAAWWPVVVLMRLRKENMALQMLPDLLPLLPPKDASELLKKMLLSSLVPGDAAPKPAPALRCLFFAICLMMPAAHSAFAQEAEIELGKPHSDPEIELRRSLDPGAVDKVQHDFDSRRDSPAVRAELLRKAMADRRFDDLSARSDAIALLHSSSYDGWQSGTPAAAARSFLDLSNNVLLGRADRSKASGQLKDAVSVYKELLHDPEYLWVHGLEARNQVRELSYTIASRSMRSGAWDDAADALEDHLTYSAPDNLDRQSAVEMYANALMNAGLMDYSKHHWFGATFRFERLVGRRADGTNFYSGGDGTGVQKELDKYVGSVSGLREKANLYLGKASHFADAEKLPQGVTAIDVLPDVGATVGHLAAGNQHKLHVFNKSGDVDMVLSPADFQNLSPLGSLHPVDVEFSSISSVVLTTEARSAMAGSFGPAGLLAGKVVWHTKSISKAAETLQELNKSRPQIDDFSLAMLLPKDETQKRKLGLDNWSEEDQRRTWDSAQSFVKRSGIRDVITGKVNRTGMMGWIGDTFSQDDTPERLFDALAQKKNVLIFIAHGDRQHL